MKPLVTHAAALAATLLLAGGCADGGRRVERPSDWEEKNARLLDAERARAVPEAPAYPKEANLLGFFVTSASDFRYFVDRASISPDAGLVRYVLVARAPGGAQNVSFEALNCREKQFRSYARGTADGKWIVRPGDWRDTEPTQRVQHTLHHQYFCPNNTPIQSRNEGVHALEKGGHPWATLPNTQGFRLEPNVR